MSAPRPTSPAPRRILIVRLSALGDIVMASGLIPALRTLYPQAELSWVCEAVCVPLLRHNPSIKQVIVWPRGEWEALLKAKRYMALWRAVRTFRARLRAEQFDLVLDAQGLLKSGLIAWLTGAPRRVSIIAREGSADAEIATRFPVGTQLRILPNHACATGAQFPEYHALDDAGKLEVWSRFYGW